MRVDSKGRTCRSCAADLEITDDGATTFVECTHCRERYLVETDAFGDDCTTYYVEFMSRRLARGDGDDQVSVPTLTKRPAGYRSRRLRTTNDVQRMSQAHRRWDLCPAPLTSSLMLFRLLIAAQSAHLDGKAAGRHIG